MLLRPLTLQHAVRAASPGEGSGLVSRKPRRPSEHRDSLRPGPPALERWGERGFPAAHSVRGRCSRGFLGELPPCVIAGGYSSVTVSRAKCPQYNP